MKRLLVLLLWKMSLKSFFRYGLIRLGIKKMYGTTGESYIAEYSEMVYNMQVQLCQNYCLVSRLLCH